MKLQTMKELNRSVCVYYRRGMTIENATTQVLDDFPQVTHRQGVLIKNQAIKELKANSDWRYDK